MKKQQKLDFFKKNALCFLGLGFFFCQIDDGRAGDSKAELCQTLLLFFFFKKNGQALEIKRRLLCL